MKDKSDLKEQKQEHVMIGLTPAFFSLIVLFAILSYRKYVLSKSFFSKSFGDS